MSFKAVKPHIIAIRKQEYIHRQNVSTKEVSGRNNMLLLLFVLVRNLIAIMLRPGPEINKSISVNHLWVGSS